MTETIDCVNQQAWLRRTLFLCKRGNLETELLLSAYAPTLLKAESDKKRLFERLLQKSDATLFDWLLTRTEAQSPQNTVPQEYRALIEEVRNNYLILNQ